jgi:hypothetical protein
MTTTRSNHVSRRKFLRKSLGAAGLAGMTAALGGWNAAGSNQANRFAYDLGAFARTDPSLVQYQESRRLRAPHGDARRLAIGPKDELYIAAGSYVTAVDMQGLPLLEVALAGPARCLAVSSSGDVYAGLRDHIEIFDSKGRRRAAWDSPGGRPWITALTLTGDAAFAADAGNRLVLRYDLSGKLVGRIGEKNKERHVPGFIIPSPFFDVKVHQDGLLRVTNPGRHRVEAYTQEGEFELAWGKPSAAIDGFCGCCNPVGVAILPGGSLVTCEKGLPRVKVYKSDGTFESVVAGPESFPENRKVHSDDSLSDGALGGLDAAVDSRGQVYVLDRVTSEIRVMVRKGAGADGVKAPPSPGA